MGLLVGFYIQVALHSTNHSMSAARPCAILFLFHFQLTAFVT